MVVIPSQIDNQEYYQELLNVLAFGEDLEFLRQRDLHHFLI